LKIKTVIFVIVIGFLLVTNAWAEHEANHRYNVRGYVLDENQKGISGLAVQIFSGTQMLGTTKTDSGGYYSLYLHLHNTDRGRILKLRAGPSNAELRVTLDPSDQSTARVHEANFVDGDYVEGRLGKFRMPAWVYPVVGLVALGFVVVSLESRRKRKIRQKMKDSHPKQHPGKHRPKKGKRKKH